MSCYITKVGEEGVKNFKYKGGSESLLYKYIWSPLASWLVDNVVPVWMAPNVITLIGTIALFSSMCLTLYYSPDAATPAPSWVQYVSSAAVLFYQVMDNMDGKQARKTGNSSPLGMLFDHGCDAIAGIMMGLIAYNSILVGGTDLTKYFFLALCWASCISFYFAMWAQYHIHCLYLGFINAIDEGLVIIWGLLLVIGYVGQELFLQEVAYGLQLNLVFIIVAVSISFGQSVDFIFQVSKHYQDSEKLKNASKNLGACAVFGITCLVIAFCSPSDILKYNFPLVLSAVGLLWCKLTLHIQISHICSQDFTWVRPTFIIPCVLTIANTLACNFGYGIEEKMFFIGLLAFATANYLHITISVSKRIGKILGIHVLHINKPKESSKGK